jgi:uncharacterized protein (DUF1697 family)
MQFAAFLRAVNVGKHNRIKMAELRQLVEHLGVADCRSYVQTGNLVFRSEGSAEEIARRIEAALPSLGCKDVDVMVRTKLQLDELMALDPFGLAAHEKSSLVSFLRTPCELPLPARQDFEVVAATGRELCYRVTENAKASSNVGALIESKLKVRATTRYWKVVAAVHEMFSSAI